MECEGLFWGQQPRERHWIAERWRKVFPKKFARGTEKTPAFDIPQEAEADFEPPLITPDVPHSILREQLPAEAATPGTQEQPGCVWKVPGAPSLTG